MSASVLIEAVAAESFGGGGGRAGLRGCAGSRLFEGRDDGSADGGQVGGPAAGRGQLESRAVGGGAWSFGVGGGGGVVIPLPWQGVRVWGGCSTGWGGR